MTSQAATAATPFTGRKMLFSVLAFFGVIIAANMTMMTFALTTHTGTVVPNSYVASQDFNKHIAADAAQKRTGLAISIQPGQEIHPDHVPGCGRQACP